MDPIPCNKDFHKQEKGQCYKWAKINIADSLNGSRDILFVLLLYCAIVIRTLSAMILLLYFNATCSCQNTGKSLKLSPFLLSLTQQAVFRHTMYYNCNLSFKRRVTVPTELQSKKCKNHISILKALPCTHRPIAKYLTADMADVMWHDKQPHWVCNQLDILLCSCQVILINKQIMPCYGKHIFSTLWGLIFFFSPMVQEHVVGQGLLIIEAS
jgi:hypothetical protein